jgi:transposase
MITKKQKEPAMTNLISRREKRSFTHEFKKQMVMLYQNGKKRADIVAEYDLTKSALDKWIKLKQAALIIGRKSN